MNLVKTSLPVAVLFICTLTMIIPVKAAPPVTEPVDVIVTEPVEAVITDPVEAVITEPVEAVITEPVEAAVTNTIPFGKLVSLATANGGASPGITVSAGPIQQSGKLHAVNLSLAPENPGDTCRATLSLVVENVAANTEFNKEIGGVVATGESTAVLAHDFASPIEITLSNGDEFTLQARLSGSVSPSAVCTIHMGGVYEIAD